MSEASSDVGSAATPPPDATAASAPGTTAASAPGTTAASAPGTTAASAPSVDAERSTPSLPAVIRLPRTGYIAVVFVFFGALPLAFSAGDSVSAREAASGADGGSSVGPQVLVLLIPIIAALFVARTATVVTTAGLKVRAPFGSKLLPWSTLRGLAVRGRAIYAVQDAGVTRLPCVRIAHLGPLSRMSGGYLPELTDAVPRPAPQRRRRR